MQKKTILITMAVIVLVAVSSSGWVYNIIHASRVNELTVLNNTFRQQYGIEAVIKQIVSPKKVYAVSWTADGYNNISWSIGGIWVKIYSVPIDENIKATP